jgi:hypothetical protein
MREENSGRSFSNKKSSSSLMVESKEEVKQSTSSSYFARYWIKTPEQLAAIEAKKQARLDKKAAREAAGTNLTTFGQWLRHYMAIVLVPHYYSRVCVFSFFFMCVNIFVYANI